MNEIITEHSEGILRVELNRPKKRNAMTSSMYVTLADVFNAAAKDEATRVVLWHGVGDSFCAGNDMQDFVAAVTLLAELGDLTRFAHPRELMGFLGLVPAQYSSGETRRYGAITKTGNGHARRVLVEAALNHRFPARMSRLLQQRQTGQPEAVRAIAWKAQTRLCHRYRRLTERGLPKNKASVAIARELAGFVWDIAGQVQPKA